MLWEPGFVPIYCSRTVVEIASHQQILSWQWRYLHVLQHNLDWDCATSNCLHNCSLALCLYYYWCSVEVWLAIWEFACSDMLQEDSSWSLALKSEAFALQSHCGGMWFHHNELNCTSGLWAHGARNGQARLWPQPWPQPGTRYNWHGRIVNCGAWNILNNKIVQM